MARFLLQAQSIMSVLPNWRATMRISVHDAGRIRDAVATISDTYIKSRFAKVAELDVRTKTSEFDVVTEVDEAVEAQLSRHLLGAFPGAVIVGEEAASKDKSLLLALATWTLRS